MEEEEECIQLFSMTNHRDCVALFIFIDDIAKLHFSLKKKEKYEDKKL